MDKPFKNIIFDFGGVIINIDYLRVIDAFINLGVKDFDALFSQLNQHHLFDDLDKGLISAEEFRHRLRSISKIPLTDEQIDKAWNAILINLPQENVDVLLRLKKKLPALPFKQHKRDSRKDFYRNDNAGFRRKCSRKYFRAHLFFPS